MVRHPIDLHPDDLAARLDLRNQLIRLREDAGHSQHTYADLLGITQRAVHDSEISPTANYHAHTAQARVRALGHRLRLTPTGLPDLPPTPTVANLERLGAASATDQQEDQLHVVAVATHLATVRRWQGIPQADLGRIIGCTESAISQAERGVTQPLLSTLQRLARGLGGWLALDLQPVTDQAATEAA